MEPSPPITTMEMMMKEMVGSKVSVLNRCGRKGQAHAGVAGHEAREPEGQELGAEHRECPWPPRRSRCPARRPAGA